MCSNGIVSASRDREQVHWSHRGALGTLSSVADTALGGTIEGEEATVGVDVQVPSRDDDSWIDADDGDEHPVDVDAADWHDQHDALGHEADDELCPHDAEGHSDAA